MWKQCRYLKKNKLFLIMYFIYCKGQQLKYYQFNVNMFIEKHISLIQTGSTEVSCGHFEWCSQLVFPEKKMTPCVLLFFFLFFFFYLLAVLWPWCFLLLYAVVSGGQTNGVQISHRESTEMVPAGKTKQNKTTIKRKIQKKDFWFSALDEDLIF